MFIREMKMKRLLLTTVISMYLMSPVMAATSAPIWTDEHYDNTGELGNNPELDDSALGVWCFLNSFKNHDGVGVVRVFERSQNCLNREGYISKRLVIIIGPRKYSALGTKGHECKAIEIKHGEYHKNVTVKYQCEQFDTKKVSNEVVELGFTNSNHLLWIKK